MCQGPFHAGAAFCTDLVFGSLVCGGLLRNELRLGRISSRERLVHEAVVDGFPMAKAICAVLVGWCVPFQVWDA